MYSTYFGLSMRPFGLQPDPRFVHENRTFLTAFRTLRDSIESGQRLHLLLGCPGTGKTTLLMRLLEDLDHPGSRVLVPYSHLSFPQILDYVLARLEQPRTAVADEPCGQALADDALVRLERRLEPVVVMLDEAQNLTPEALRGFQDLAARQEEELGPVQIVLAGAPELALLMEQSCSGEPIGATDHPVWLDTLREQEVLEYIGHRLSLVSDSAGALFDEQALSSVVRHSRGVPRLVNLISDKALLMAYSNDEQTVTEATVERAVRDAGLDLELEFEELENLSAQLRADHYEAPEPLAATVAESLVDPQGPTIGPAGNLERESAERSHRSRIARVVDCVEPGLKDALAEVRRLTRDWVTGARARVESWRHTRIVELEGLDDSAAPNTVEPSSVEAFRRQWLNGLPVLAGGWVRGEWRPKPVHVAAACALVSTAGMVWALLVMVDSGVEQELRAVNADLVQERSAAGDLRDQLTRLAVELENSRIDQEILYSITAGLQDELKAGSALVKVGWAGEPDAPVVFRAGDTSTADTGKAVVPLSAEIPATADPSPYLVKKGDTLWSIARTHGLSVRQLSSWNRLTAENAIQVGQQLQVSALVDGGDAVRLGTDLGSGSHYTVKPGDSLYGISRHFNVSVADLRQWNRLDNGEIIIAEQQLIVLR